MSTISVIGAGAWGTALAQVIATRGDNVCLWTLEPEHAEAMNSTHRNDQFLQGIDLSHNIKVTSTLEDALENDVILLVTPAQFVRPTVKQIKDGVRDSHKLILCSKGIEIESGQLMSQIVQDILPNIPIAVLSGPNFAREIAQGKPAATTLACKDDDIAKILQDAVASSLFRPYISNDIIGAQIAGSLKNVIAIACGMAEGLQVGESARASLITRGLAEIARLGVAMGAQYETFLGLSGVGDIMLTCSSEQSRNFSLGLALGTGMELEDAMDALHGIAEGYYTSKAAMKLSEKHGIDMPISLAVYRCTHGELTLDEAVEEMLNRPLGHER